MDINITKQRAAEFGLEAQRADETDIAFRERISDALRAAGRIIEAHEAYNGALYNQDDNTMAGIIGAVANAMLRPGQPEDIGDDIAAGFLVKHPASQDDGSLHDEDDMFEEDDNDWIDDDNEPEEHILANIPSWFDYVNW